tara:strand:- start:897 stop:1100 length:204 start_codon:yes stop_codon:yes gene_type:complete
MTWVFMQKQAKAGKVAKDMFHSPLYTGRKTRNTDPVNLLVMSAPTERFSKTATQRFDEKHFDGIENT